MKNKIFRPVMKAFFAGLILLAVPVGAEAQKKAKVKNVPVTVKVVDADGNAVAGASIVVGEGLIHATTDANGEYSFKAKPQASVTVYMIGYEKYKGFVASLQEDNKIVLEDAEFLRTEDDVVYLPFGRSYRRYSTDNITTVSGEELSKYPSTDLRNALVGLFPGFVSTEKDGQPGLSAEESTGKYGSTDKVSQSSRGQELTFIVDDVMVDISEMPLDPEEIESVSLLKDAVSKAMYGPLASGGVIYIKTKRGKANEKRITASAEAGVSVVDRFPEFVTGVDYAKLNNMARVNSGYEPLYSEEDIKQYGKNDPFNMLYPNVNFRDLLFKNTRSYQKVNVAAYGGNDKVQYSTYVGYAGEGDIYRVGSDANYNRINVRSNIDMKLNKMLTLRFDFAGNLNIRKSPNYNNVSESDDAYETIHEFTTVIEHANNISPIAFPVYTGIDRETGLRNYGISSVFQYNPVGGLEGNGSYTEMNRSGVGNISLDIDFGQWVKGLKSTTYIGFNGAYLTRIGKNEEYAAYMITPVAQIAQPTPEQEKLGYGLTLKRAAEMNSEYEKMHDYYNVRYTGYEKLSYERQFKNHYLNTGLTLYMSQLTRKGYKEPLRQANGIFDITYSFKDKYIVQGAVDYAGSNYLAPGNRYAMFPTAGLAWVVSEEDFMKKQNVIDYLKVRVQGGQLGSMVYKTTYKYETDWNASNTNLFGYPENYSGKNWMGGSKNTSQLTSTTYNSLGNPHLDWEKINEISAGMEVYLLKRRLMLDFSYYNRTRFGIIEQVNNVFPVYCGFFTLPYQNFGKINYHGYELMASYGDKVGDFSYKVSAYATMNRSKYLIYDEPMYPENEAYRYRRGDEIGAIYGLEYVGKFATDEEAAEYNQKYRSIYSSELKAGDLIYKDLNGDGLIDNRDIKKIGSSEPKMNYAFTVNLAYKGFEFTAVANGIVGRESMLSNSYYRNGWGNNNYSVWVRDNIGGEYPRLTYDKVDHNFQNSAFWMRKSDFFKLQNVEIAYNLPAKLCGSIGLGGIRVFAKGANLLTISGIKDTDPESMNAGVTTYPLYSTYVGGIKLTF